MEPAAQAADMTSFWGQMDAVSMGALVILILMSAASWYYAVIKGMAIWRVRRDSEQIVDEFWGSPSLPQAMGRMEQHGEDPFSRMAVACAKASGHFQKQGSTRLGESADLSDFLTRALRQFIAREQAQLESGLTVLATVGSTAPFVGLFGTVWGIFHALTAISREGQASLETVAGPVGEALIMTAIGLAVAIPAVFVYNTIVRNNRLILTELDAFAHDLHAFFTTGARVEEGSARDFLHSANTRSQTGKPS